MKAKQVNELFLFDKNDARLAYARWKERGGQIRIETDVIDHPKNTTTVKPGIYHFLEYDEDGRRAATPVSFKVLSEMDAYELALQIAEKTGYISPWGYMELRSIDSANYGNNVFPLDPKLFNENLNESFASEEGRKIQQIVNILGYDDFDHFLEDNPGCMEAVLDWIDNSFTDQLSSELSKEELESLGLYNSADEA